ncbi:MAG: hypothetical protein KF708_03070 [Pirellulales bacterium]|nr:hypothetical protein [Pirellulales bacterium]
MGRIRTSLSRLSSRLFGRNNPHPGQAHAERWHRCTLDVLEERRLLASDIYIGSVYYEGAEGDDATGDKFYITFQGGAPGTQLDRIVIDGDKEGNGLTNGDTFFDTAPGGLGAFGSFPFTQVQANGFTITNISVTDGGTQLVLDFSGFDAGELLIFSIDVDEQGFLQPNSIAEGREFEGASFQAFFTAPHYFDINGKDLYLDEYDDKLAQASAAGLGLNLPPDNYIPPATNDLKDFTAGAIFKLTQTPLPITISGKVFEDMNLNNSQEGGDPGIAGVNLTLYQKVGNDFISTNKSVTTDANGYYKFEGVLPGEYEVRETQPNGYFSVGAKAGNVAGSPRGSVKNNDAITGIVVNGGEDSVHNDFAEACPASLSGHVYHDRDNDGVRDLGEEAIAGVSIEVQFLPNGGPAPAPIVVVTDANGFWEVTGLAPGSYKVTELHPTGWLDGLDSAGNAGGTAQNPGDSMTGIFLGSAQAGINYDFGELKPGSIHGRVYVSDDPNFIYHPGDPVIAGVTIWLLDAAGNRLKSTLTDANGEYHFTDLALGTYGVEEVQPAGYYDHGDVLGTLGGVIPKNDFFGGIVITSGAHGFEYNFSEQLPASIKGRVYQTLDGDCDYQPTDPPLAGVVIYLLDSQGNRIGQTVTDANGEYQFTNLVPGTYGIEEIQPNGFFDGGEKAGSVGGNVTNDKITNIVLGSGVNAVEYNFCEIPPASLSGKVYVDHNNNGQINSGEPGIAGVTLHLLDSNGNPTGLTTVTDASGNYSFQNLQPGTYSVVEVHPTGYIDGLDTPGSHGGSAQNPGDRINGITLLGGANAVNYNFGELQSASIRGRVYLTLDGDCDYQPTDPPLAGVIIYLLDTSGNRIAQTVTDVNGEYVFTNLSPGTYGIEESQPAGYLDGGEKAGSAGGNVTNDKITNIFLGSGVNAVEYNFCEIPPASLQGTVYVDLNNNGVKEANEPGIAGVTVQLLDANQAPTGKTTVTDASGNYGFYDLYPGTYSVNEVHPAGYFDGIDTPGSVGGVAQNPGDRITHIVLAAGVAAVDYNFGELLGSEIRGRVHLTLDGDCTYEPGDPPVAGVTIWLLDSLGNRIRSTVTDANGEYAFTDLMPGTYGVEEIQPTQYLDGGQEVGTAGGVNSSNDRITEIVLTGGTKAFEYNFCEIPAAKISGYVFVDGSPLELSPSQAKNLSAAGVLSLAQAEGYNFTRDASDKPIAGVVLRLGNAFGEPILDDHGNPITTVTDKNGYYEFANLRPGVYTVLQDHPTKYVDGLDSAGSTGGFAVNQGDTSAASLLTVPANNDAIARIAVTAGVVSVENNFAELETTSTPLFFPPQNPPPSTVPGPTQYAGPQQPFQTYSPVLSPDVVRPTYFGGVGWRSTIGNTWHLSVINGGRPRADQFATELLQQVSSRFNVHAWTGLPLDNSLWQLHERDGAPVAQYIFGTERGIPVVGDWNGDGRDEVGVYVDGEWFLDLDGDGQWDEHDLWAKLGTASDQPVVGDWDGDGKDDIGIFGFAWPGDLAALVHEPGLPDPENLPSGAQKNVPPDPDKATLGNRAMKRTIHGKVREDLIDHVFHYGSEGDVAVTGDWNGDGIATIGLFRSGTWILDDNGNGRWDLDDRVVDFGAPGDRPVVGDFDGDGIDEVGVYRHGTWIIDTNHNLQLDDEDARYELGGPGDIPVVGDWDGDGRDEIGVYQQGKVVRPET